MDERLAPRDWSAEIEALNTVPDGERSIVMGSAGSAQVTRVRLLERWDGLEAWTEGPVLHLRRIAQRCVPKGAVPPSGPEPASPGADDWAPRADLRSPHAAEAVQIDFLMPSDSAMRDDPSLRGLRACAALLQKMVESNTLPKGYAERALDALHLARYGSKRTGIHSAADRRGWFRRTLFRDDPALKR